MEEIYFIGGSPCSGKSTVARRIAKERGWVYFEADEFLWQCIQEAKADKKPYAARQAEIYGDAKWMRDPYIQAKEELLLYEELFPYYIKRLHEERKKGSVLAEGAAFLPNLVYNYYGTEAKYLCMIPEKEFQYENYRKRTWAMEVVKECKMPSDAFENWMIRDHLFAEQVRRRAEKYSYPVVVTDRVITRETAYRRVNRNFQ